MIVLFIAHLVSCYVENQVPPRAFGFRWSTQKSGRSKDQNAGRQPAVEDCAPAWKRVCCRVIARQVVSAPQSSRLLEPCSRELLERGWLPAAGLEIPKFRKA